MNAKEETVGAMALKRALLALTLLWLPVGRSTAADFLLPEEDSTLGSGNLAIRDTPVAAMQDLDVDVQELPEAMEEPPRTTAERIEEALPGDAAELEEPPVVPEQIGPLDESLEPMPLEVWEGDEHGPFGPPSVLKSSGSWLRRGHWYTQHDVAYLHRSGPEDNFPITFEITGMRGDQDRQLIRSLSTVTDLGFAPMARLTLGRFLGRDMQNRSHSFEVTYFGLGDWFEEQGITAGTGNLLITPLNANVEGFNEATTQRFEYQSELDSLELNARIARRLDRDRMVLRKDGVWVRTCSPDHLPALFGGLRFVRVDETFGFFSQGATTTGAYRVTTENDLIGMQIGTEAFFQHCNWSIGARVKGGPYLNFAEQFTDIRTTGTTAARPDRTESADHDTLAFVGEVRIIGGFQLRPNMAFRASYDLMWINQVALAPEQVTFAEVNPPQIITGGALFYQGVSVGLEMVW